MSETTQAAPRYRMPRTMSKTEAMEYVGEIVRKRLSPGQWAAWRKEMDAKGYWPMNDEVSK